ncbi:hypothetical protein KY360_00045 [Candidatus Woesearchaeota archaeon]|nr:hypothetical protein [Candidatus Woesearchaeota archaeon]
MVYHRKPGTEYVSKKRLEAEALSRYQAVTKRIEDELGQPALEAAGRIRAGTHTIDDVFLYGNRLKKVFVGTGTEQVLRHNWPGIIKYSDSASNAAPFLVSDLETSISTGTTYSNAVHGLSVIDDRFSEKLVDVFRGTLYGKKADGSYNVAFPALLTALWMLKDLRPTTYKNSVNAAKWTALLGEAVNANEDIGFRIDIRELFIYALVQNIGMLDPEMPLEVPGKVFSAEEKSSLAYHGPKGIQVLDELGFNKTYALANVVGFHSSPRQYQFTDFEQLIAAEIALNSGAESFEGMFFKREHRPKQMTHLEVVGEIGGQFFTEKELAELQAVFRKGYTCSAKLARKYPFLPAFQRIRLVVGDLDKQLEQQRKH